MNPVPFILLAISLPLLLGSVCNAELRTWTAVNGKEVEAEFVSNEKGIVKLKLKSGKVFEVSLNKLSKADQEFVAAQSPSPDVTQLERALIGKRIVLAAADYRGAKIEIPIVFPNGATDRPTGWLNRISIHRLEGFYIDGPPGGPIRLNLRPDTSQYSFDLNETPNGSPLIGTFTFRSEDPKVGDKVTLTTPQGVGRSSRDDSIKGDDNQELVITKIDHVKEVGGLYYKVADDAVTISGCNPLISGEIKIPSRIDGSAVTKIGKRAFGAWGGELKVTGIILPPQLKEIGDEAFQGCTLIKGIEIPKSVTRIGSSAFRYCTGLTSVTIPASVSSVGKNAFERCKELTAATFLGDAPEAGGYIFSSNVTIYRKPEAKGWSDTFADRPVHVMENDPIREILNLAIDHDSLQARNDLHYRVNEIQPFSGWSKKTLTLANIEVLTQWKDGKQDGVEVRRNLRGRKIMEQIYKDGKQHGSAAAWYANGQKEQTATFKNGKLDGLMTTWHENGQKRQELTFKDGKADGLAAGWHDNGQKMVEATFKDGKQDGLATAWHENSQKQAEVIWKDGERLSAKFWNSKGEEVETEEDALK